MIEEHTIIIGAGPCGLSCAIELQKEGINPLIIEKGCIVNTVYHFPTHQTFFSSSDKLEIGNFPFITEKHRPVRNEALTYYREVAKRKKIRINTYEEAISFEKENDHYILDSMTMNQKRKKYKAKNIIIATGYYDQAKELNIPGETLEKISHYFHEAHSYFGRNVIVIGGKNSAVDATIELEKAGANVTVLYRGSDYSKSIKPWILPQFDSLIRHGKVNMKFNAEVTKITKKHVYYKIENTVEKIKNDFVFAMIGYKPNIDFLTKVGITIDQQSGKPNYNIDTYESNLPNIYVAGVIVSGFNTSETFIENGRHHGEEIAQAIKNNE